jgi:hypothetical protein
MSRSSRGPAFRLRRAGESPTRRRPGWTSVAAVTVLLLAGLWMYDAMQLASRDLVAGPARVQGDPHRLDEPTSDRPDPFSHASTWRRLESRTSLVAALLSSCRDPEQVSCVTDFMEEHGAKEAAIDFYRRTRTFLTSFKESGEVDVGMMLDPWLANNNTRAVLLNGVPAILEPHETELPMATRRDPDFRALKERYRSLDAGIQFPLFERVRRASERSGYVFQFYLEDGCHACATGFRARVMFSVAAGGALESVGSLGICDSNDIMEAPGEPSRIAGCPAPPRDLYPGSDGPR